MLLFNWAFAFVLLGMTIPHIIQYVRYRRPYRIFFTVVFALLLLSHQTHREDLLPLIAVTMTVAIIMKLREPAVVRKMMLRELSKTSKPVSPERGVWDKDLDGI